MRVLITGGAGFIGSGIARAYIARGADVTVVDSLVTGRRAWVPDGARFHLLDIRDPLLERVFQMDGPFDVVSHHAALKDVRKALIDPSGDADANIIGTLNVLRCAAEHDTGRLMFPSSAAVYGDAAVLPISETASISPISPYGISKAASELYCAYFAHNRGLSTVALRCGTVYGPAAAEESESGVITIFARRMLAGRQPTIYGSGEQTRDLVHVQDVVRANLLAAERAPRPWSVYNVSTGTQNTINDVYRRLAAETGFPTPPNYEAPKPGEILFNQQDVTRIFAEIGWRAETSLDEGLADVVRAYRRTSEMAAPVAAAP